MFLIVTVNNPISGVLIIICMLLVIDYQCYEAPYTTAERLSGRLQKFLILIKPERKLVLKVEVS